METNEKINFPKINTILGPLYSEFIKDYLAEEKSGERRIDICSRIDDLLKPEISIYRLDGFRRFMKDSPGFELFYFICLSTRVMLLSKRIDKMINWDPAKKDEFYLLHVIETTELNNDLSNASAEDEAFLCKENESMLDDMSKIKAFFDKEANGKK